MADVGSLIESAQARGLRLFLEGDKVKIRAPQNLDGETKSLIQELREHKEEVKLLIQVEEPPIRAWVVEEVRGDDGKLRAVLVCSAFLQDDLWMIFDRSFEPKDDWAVYYSEEIPLLKSKTPEEIIVIHKAKLAFPGMRVIQEGAEVG